MYKSFTADEYRKHFKIPLDYKVKGFLSYGAWSTDQQFESLKNTLNRLSIEYTVKKLEGFLMNVYELTMDQDKYWFTVMYGGALLSEYVHLACLFGSEKNIHIGSCGGLYPEINSLDLIIPEWSYGNESTTRVYEPRAIDFKHYSNGNLSKLIQSKITSESKVYNGPLMTNQAMMGESLEDVKLWSKKGFYGVEMESATVFSVSNNFNVPSAALVYVSDNLIKGQTVADASHLEEKERREKLKKTVYEVAILSLLSSKN